MEDENDSNYKWYILGITALTNTLAMAVPNMCMPVLFDEISRDIDLNLLQIGTIWAMVPLAGILFIFIGGSLVDRYGAKRVLVIACLLAGLAGALRGISWNFASLAATSFIFGMVAAVIPTCSVKTASTWFSGRQLGIALGVLTTGMGIGLTLTATISATVMSPLLGGWRQVLYVYGGISVMISLFWLFTVKESEQVKALNIKDRVPFRQAIKHIFSIRQVWFLGLTMLGYVGCIRGMTGYLPLYLRNRGWAAASADGTLATFNGLSTFGAIPLTFLSDRLGLRKAVMYVVLVLTIVGISLLSVADGALVWVLVIMVGIGRDGFMALSTTLNVETKGIGIAYTGMAVGLMQTITRIGSFISPPVGNSVADSNPGLPFIIWAAFGLVSLISFLIVRETGRRQS